MKSRIIERAPNPKTIKEMRYIHQSIEDILAPVIVTIFGYFFDIIIEIKGICARSNIVFSVSEAPESPKTRPSIEKNPV